MPGEDGLFSVRLDNAITGCEDIPVYSCPVAAAKAGWVGQVFAVNRNEATPLMLQHIFPDNPSAPFIEAVEYVRVEVKRLHAAQQKRLESP